MPETSRGKCEKSPPLVVREQSTTFKTNEAWKIHDGTEIGRPPTDNWMDWKVVQQSEPVPIQPTRS